MEHHEVIYKQLYKYEFIFINNEDKACNMINFDICIYL